MKRFITTENVKYGIQFTVKVQFCFNIMLQTRQMFFECLEELTFNEINQSQVGNNVQDYWLELKSLR